MPRYTPERSIPELPGITIDTMVLGQFSHAAPWAMWLDREGNYWLHPKYVVHDSASSVGDGYEMLWIHRSQKGYSVRLAINHRYTPKDDPKYVGSPETTYLPVIALF